MILMVEKGIRDGICHAIQRYAKANDKYMKGYDKNKESSYLNYWDLNNLHRWAMSQNLSIGGFKWVENTSQLKKGSMENCNEDSDEGYFLKPDVQYSQKLLDLHNDISFCQKEFEKFEKLLANLHHN